MFPPKNVTASETLNGALRRPADTRPLSLKDASNKSIASVVNRAWRTALAEELDPCQLGFLAGRTRSRNIVDIDYKGRCFALEPEGPDPVIVLFDFLAAFPSLSHCFIFFLFHWLALLPGHEMILREFYTDVDAVDPAGTFLFQVLSGVLQGCPLSGSIFALAADPSPFAKDPVMRRSRSSARLCGRHRSGSGVHPTHGGAVQGLRPLRATLGPCIEACQVYHSPDGG